MKKKQQKLLVLLVVAVVVVGIIWFFATRERQPGELDTFAECLDERGATFYGAFWCPHCDNQKKMFGASADMLPYVECSTADGRGQLQVCQEANIEGYPTWEFADDSRLTGEVPLRTLAEKTGCELP